MPDKTHMFHYLIIAGILCIGVISIIFFPIERSLQFAIVSFLAIFYLCYGILHHLLEHDLTVKIVIEYVLIAFLVIALFFLVRGGS